MSMASIGDDARVIELARRAGIVVEWTNAAGQPQIVGVPVLRRLLAALGLPADSRGETAESAAQLDGQEAQLARAPLVTATVDEPITIRSIEPSAPSTALLVMESGARHDIRPNRCGDQLTLGTIPEPGYHTLHLRDRVVTLAIAPKRAFTSRDIDNGRLWGVAVQVYGLRCKGDGGIGNTKGLSAFAVEAARYGADAIALSPMHAMFGADLGRYGPYSPSNRLLLNPLFADPCVAFDRDTIATAICEVGIGNEMESLETAELIDWPASAKLKLALFRRLFERARTCPDGDFAAFRQRQGDILEQHALFEVLHSARLADDPNSWSWRQWPKQWQNPESTAVREFAAAHAEDVTFQVFLQWLVDRSLAGAQTHAREAGMRIGLIADLAIGMDVDGSHAWSRQRDLLVGLKVGAPPDIFNPRGQDWGLTAFSPHALMLGGFAPFIATLRTALRNAGGVRLDHAMGLKRLWLVPEGATPAEGAYLAYPFDDLLRLLKLETCRHHAIAIGEDLGTVPEGFGEVLADSGVAGMRVLWFERDGQEFLPPAAWSSDAVAMTSTHDLPTVAGWWQGADIDMRAKFGLLGPGANIEAERRQRAADRQHLWDAFRANGVTRQKTPPSDSPAAVDAAIRYVAATRSPLALIPLEDMLGANEQPNLPGTVGEHPNWRRRYPGDSQSQFDSPQMQERARSLNARRSG